jgi:hypothetical protein
MAALETSQTVVGPRPSSSPSPGGRDAESITENGEALLPARSFEELATAPFVLVDPPTPGAAKSSMS